MPMIMLSTMSLALVQCTYAYFPDTFEFVLLCVDFGFAPDIS